MPTRQDFIYLAGLFDGEGCVGTYSKGTQTTAKRFEIAIKMTHEPTIDWLVQTFGGSKMVRKPQQARWKTQWRWRMSNKAAEDVYRRMKPWLKIK